MLVVKIDDIVKSCDIQYQITARKVLDQMKSLKCRGSYQEYFPHLPLDGNTSPVVRQHIGGVLLGIWTWCMTKSDHLMPMLPMLIQLKGQEIAGEGMQRWYIDIFGTLENYDFFCKNYAEYAEKQLQSGVLVLE